MSCRRLVGLCCAFWATAASAEPPSFVNDVLPVLTRQGCNQGACHGKGSGQNGFRLSLRGYAPELDHQWLTREFGGRRVVAPVPEDSILLRKPTGLAPHEGGKLFEVGSREYRVLRDWLAAGCPGPAKTDPTLTKFTLTPTGQTLAVGQDVQLMAWAEYSDGQRRDVTWLTKFDSNDAGLMSVTAAGRVQALRHGETTVRASFQGAVAAVVLTAPYPKPVDPRLFAAKNNFIDEAVFAKLQKLRIEPSDLCGDAEFIRRVFLDTAGILPTPDEVRAFVSACEADKRQQLIESVLSRPEYVDFWAQRLGDLFQNRKERDHDVRGTKGVRTFHNWLRQQVAANRPWDQMVTEVLTASGTTADHPAIGYFVVTVGEHREAEKSEVAASAAQAFLGTRIGCAQCHNHPLERYTQDDYYHFAAYFSRVKLDRKDERQGATRLSAGRPNADENKRPIGVHQPRTGAFLKPQALDRTRVPLAPGEDPRPALAAWMTDPKNESFSGAMVNRLWAHYLGIGLVEPVDDLRASNPPTNPVLWQALKAEFVRGGFDLKHLTRLILNSRTYQLSAATRPGNAADTRFYSHYYARRLPAEVLADAISTATGVPDVFPGYPIGLRATQLPDPTLKSYFLTLFGRSERVTACACERNGEVTMPQLLHLQNGDVLRKVSDGNGRLAKLLRTIKDDQRLTCEVFLMTLSREPTANEWKAVRRSLSEGDGREEVFRDLFWALLNAKEFAFNR